MARIPRLLAMLARSVRLAATGAAVFFLSSACGGELGPAHAGGDPDDGGDSSATEPVGAPHNPTCPSDSAMCQPVVVANIGSYGNPTALAVNADSLYWTTEWPGLVMKVPTDGG